MSHRLKLSFNQKKIKTIITNCTHITEQTELNIILDLRADSLIYVKRMERIQKKEKEEAGKWKFETTIKTKTVYEYKKGCNSVDLIN